MSTRDSSEATGAMAKRAHLVDINDLAGVDHGNLPCNVLDLAERVR